MGPGLDVEIRSGIDRQQRVRGWW
jgi:hypothetical protein